MITYTYTIEGRAADDQTWTVVGAVETEREGDFMNAVNIAMREGFMELTRGKAVYGRPGEGCRGPYQISRLEITRS